MRNAVIAACLILTSTTAAANPADEFQRVQADYWQEYLRANPLSASLAGIRTYDRELGEIGPDATRRRVDEAKALIARLDAIDVAALPESERTNHFILRRQLADFVPGAMFGTNFLGYSSRGTFGSSLAQALSRLPLRTAEDYDNLLARLSLAGAALRKQTAIDVDHARKGFARPCSTLAPLDQALAAAVEPDATKSAYYEPFAKAAPAGIDAAQWATVQARARSIIAEQINPALEAFRAAYAAELRPRCRTSDSVASLPGGAAHYAYLARYHTTTAMTPDEIHALGLGEVARIRAEMDSVAQKAGFASRAAMIADMRTNPAYFAKSPEELMRVTARMAKRIDGMMPRLFGRLARLPYTIREVPAAIAGGTTTAYYNQGSPETGIAGTYFVNTSKLDQRPFWEVPALTVHEAVPGHHQQIAIQQELDMPEWRKATTFFTAFVEGWGLYSERLGIEMELYDTPQNDMGRLGYEMWRACRLVVDTGLHAKGWTKAQAVQYFRDNSTLTDANIDAEVNRYIGNPGQALAYKIGELKIRELRARAERTLGPRFDLRRFHDAVLGQGSVPLDLLDRQVSAWIAAEARRGA